MFEKILIPIDGSDCSKQAQSSGIELAKRFNAEATFVYVIEDPATSLYGAEIYGYEKDLYQSMRNHGASVLESAVNDAKNQGVNAHSVLLESASAVNSIVEIEDDYDLIVISTHGRRGVNRWLLGSVTESVLRRSNKPHFIARCLDAA